MAANNEAVKGRVASIHRVAEKAHYRKPRCRFCGFWETRLHQSGSAIALVHLLCRSRRLSTMILARQATDSAYVEEGSNKMASIKMIPENEAIGKIKDIYEEIKTELGIDFVPNLYKVMASKPGVLEANWNKVKAVMVEPGKLDRLTKEIIAVAVSSVNACGY